MKKKKRISVILLAGILLLGAGLIGLQTTPGLIQYAFIPGSGTAADTQSQYETVRNTLAEAFPRLTLAGVRNGVTLTAAGLSQNDVCLYRTGAEWHDVYPRRMLSGRMITGADAEAGAKVIVLDGDTAFRFFGEKDAVGNTVTLGDQTLEVVGVAEHSRRIGETGKYAAWTPLGAASDCEMMTLTAVDPGNGGMATAFQNAAAESFGSGTLISLYKEKTRAEMMPRWIAVFLAVWLLKRGIGLLTRYWRRQMAQVREESQKRYTGRLIPYAAARIAPAALLTAAVIGAGYALAVFAVSPAYVFPEWIPESLGDFSKWGERFWHLTGTSAKAVTLKTPELAEIRFWGGLVRWGTVMALFGAMKTAMMFHCIKEND